MLNAPSASKCPPGATVGVGNDPPPQPTPTLTCVLVTVTHAPPPHRPSASVAGGATAFCGDVGVIVVTCCVALFVTETNAQSSDDAAVTCTRSRGADVTSIGSCA